MLDGDTTGQGGRLGEEEGETEGGRAREEQEGGAAGLRRRGWKEGADPRFPEQAAHWLTTMPGDAQRPRLGLAQDRDVRGR